MAGEQQRCDCELGLDEATTGDLPLVCVRCGEATDSIYLAPLEYGRKRFLLRLPLCRSHRNHWRRRGWARLAFGGGIGLAVLGLTLGGLSNELPQPIRSSPLPAAFLLIFVVGTLVTFGSLGARIVLAVSATVAGIRIKRLSPESVTLTGVAPEFVEACRVYHRDKMREAITRRQRRPKADGQDLAASGIPLAEDVLQVLQVAAVEARESGQDYLGTKHLLVALRVTTTTAAHALQSLGFDAEQLREACRATTPAVPALPSVTEVSSTPAVRRALTQAATEAGSRNHTSVHAGHLLLALLREPENEAVQLLLDLGVSPEEAGRRVEEAVRFLEGVMVKDESVM